MATPFQTALTGLGLSDNPDCITSDSANLPPAREEPWRDVRRRFGIDALYFRDGIPILYVKELAAESDDELFNLHRRLWNYNLAPLLVAVLPDQVRVYDCFRSPRPDGLQDALVERLDLIGDALRITDEAAVASEPFAELGLAGTWLSRVSRGRRVDRKLLANLRTVRRRLIDATLDITSANRLIMRSLLVRYLEANGHLARIEPGSERLIDLLRAGTAPTYQFFQRLADRFNGDVLPVTDEEQADVDDAHLNVMADFLAATDLESGQTAFWEYDFSCIPVELISSIYEEFLGEDQSALSAYYTPLSLVNLILDELLPAEATHLPRVLDPACGSGVFLLGAFKRLVGRWRRSHDREPTHAELTQIMTEHLFGVDRDANALSVTAFSCYLGILETLSSSEPAADGVFPRLRDHNLFAADFFAWREEADNRFDLIVTNPPWGKPTPAARRYIAARQVAISRNQIAHAFLWKAHELLDSGGIAGLILPSRTSLFATGTASLRFRESVVSSMPVRLIIDLSDFHSQLFAQAHQPAAVFIIEAGPRGDDGQSQARSVDGSVEFWALHRSPVGEQLPGLVLSGDEMHRVPVSEAIRHPHVWKTLAWGRLADHKLIKHMQAAFPTLGEVARRSGWLIAEGLQVGGGQEKEAPQLSNLPFVDTSGLHPFSVDLEAPLQQRAFHRPRVRTVSVFTRRQRVLISEGTDRRRAIAAAFVDQPVTFTDSLVGVASDDLEQSESLRCICAVMNSSLAHYYLFLTSGKWGIERGAIEKQDLVRFPWPERTLLSRRHLAIYATLARFVPSGDHWRDELDDLVFQLYDISRSDQTLVQGALAGPVERYAQYGEYAGFHRVSDGQLLAYASILSAALRATLGSTFASFAPLVQQSGGGYAIVGLSLLADGAGESPQTPALRDALARLDAQWRSGQTRSLYIRRNAKVIQADTVYVVKPSEAGYWTDAAAYDDADDILMSLLNPTLALTRASA